VKPIKIDNISGKLDALFTPFINTGSKFGISANHISLLQVPFVPVFLFALMYKALTYAFIALAITLVLDLLDGAWARVTNDITKKGHIYDKAMDLLGIYAFLIGATIGFPELIFINVILGISTALIYFTNEYIEPELYCGVRSFALLGLLFQNLYPFLLVSAMSGIAMLLFKVVKAVKFVKS